MTLHVRARLIGVFLLLPIVVIFQNNLYGENKLQQENTRGFKGFFSFGAVYNRDNIINVSGAFNLSVKYFEKQNLLLFNSRVNYGEINYNGSKYIENVNQYYLNFKHMIYFKQDSRGYFYYDVGDKGNLFAGIKNSFNIGQGVGYNFIEEINLLLRCELGSQYNDSKYLFQEEQKAVSGTIFYQLN